jgi:transcriptional regulator with XRE-family HTH domain
MTFGETIRLWRVQRGLALRDVAKACGCSYVYIGEVERGDRGPFTAEMTDRVCAALKCDADQRAELGILRVITIGRLDLSGLSEGAVRKLLTLRDELRAKEET